MSPRVTRGALGAGTDYDEHDFGRPAKHSRPRTKDRPDYSGLPLARVLTIDRGRYRCRLGHTDVTCMKARSLGRKSVIVGDLVRLDGETSGAEGTLARIVEVAPRATVLRRTADDNDPYERPIVANADQLMIVAALADPPPRPGMIDRILAAAYEGGLHPILCLTKNDLASPADLVASYQPLGLPIVITHPDSDLSEIRDLLASHITVLVGHSGVGKSTLINRLLPGAERVTGKVNDVTGKGRHTSTSAIALPLEVELPNHLQADRMLPNAVAGSVPASIPGSTPTSIPGLKPSDQGWVIDTPGVRSFGLNHLTRAYVLGAFPDLEKYTADCPRACSHTDNAPECGLDEAVRDGQLAPQRLASFRRIMDALPR